DAWRPTSSGIATCGKTTTSRRGRTGGREAAMGKRYSWPPADARGWRFSNWFAPLYATAHSERSGRRPPTAKKTPAPFRPGVVATKVRRGALGFLFLSLRRDLEQRRGAVHDRRFGDLHLFDVFARRQVEHDFGEELFENRTEAAGARPTLERLAGDSAERRVL